MKWRTVMSQQDAHNANGQTPANLRRMSIRIDPVIEERYWRDRFSQRPYVVLGSPYEDYDPAYRCGWELFPRHAGKTFSDVEDDVRLVWESLKGSSKLTWSLARYAARDAWDRLTRHHP
jgi:hypothetical protein